MKKWIKSWDISTKLVVGGILFYLFLYVYIDIVIEVTSWFI